MSELVVIEKTELKALLKSILKEEISKLLPKPDPNGKTYTRAQVGKILGRGSRKINELIELGVIKITRDGKITEAALNDYLQNK